jgi:hypothetical protein
VASLLNLQEQLHCGAHDLSIDVLFLSNDKLLRDSETTPSCAAAAHVASLGLVGGMPFHDGVSFCGTLRMCTPTITGLSELFGGVESQYIAYRYPGCSPASRTPLLLHIICTMRILVPHGLATWTS